MTLLLALFWILVGQGCWMSAGGMSDLGEPEENGAAESWDMVPDDDAAEDIPADIDWIGEPRPDGPTWDRILRCDSYLSKIDIGATSDGGVVVTGCDHFVVARLDRTGNVVWHRELVDEEGGVHESSAILVDSEGHIVIGGQGSSFNGPMMVVKISGSGDILWQRSYDLCPLGEFLESIAECPEGGYAVIGHSETLHEWVVLKIDDDGGPEWQKKLERGHPSAGLAISPTPDGGWIAGGGAGTPRHEGSDAWVIRMDGRGNVLWQKIFGAEDISGIHDIRPTADGGYIAAGNMVDHGSGYYHDAFVIKLGDDGSSEWQKRFGGSGWESADAVLQTDDGGYAVSGTTYTFGNGTADFWLLKLDATGSLSWAKSYGLDSDEESAVVVRAPDGGYVMAGSIHYPSPVYVGGLWVLKVDPSGDIQGCPPEMVEPVTPEIYDVPSVAEDPDVVAEDIVVEVTEPAASVLDISWDPVMQCGR